jgi:phosphate:Na+ symporter
MKLMSESLQKVFGEKIRLMLLSMNSNKFRGVFTGFAITALVQSSSATSVMVVSFVNGGILRLVEAVSVIMGANIGTTFTAWLIAFFGFQLNFSIYTFPLIGLAIPFLFSKKQVVKSWGEMILGFSLVFIAISFLKDVIPMLNDSSFAFFVERIENWGYFSYLIFLIVGSILTIVIRSSSAILAVTIVLAVNGWINFEFAAAMVLGENIGTTVAAIKAARVTSITARRAALAHFFFNLFGVIWVMVIFTPFLKGIGACYMYLGGSNPFEKSSAIPLALALFHTLFNLLNSLLLIGFTKQIARFVIKTFPDDGHVNSQFRLSYLKVGLLSTPDASIYQARSETVAFAEKVRKMFINVEHSFYEVDQKEYLKLKAIILKAEDYSDRVEKEIANYLTKVGERRLSQSSSRRMRALFKMIDDIESIADSCVNLLKAIDRKKQQRIVFPEQVDTNVRLIFEMVRGTLDVMVTMLTHDEEMPLSMAQDAERELNNFRDILKGEHLVSLENGLYNYDVGTIYIDIISHCERIGDYVINVDESFKTLF